MKRAKVLVLMTSPLDKIAHALRVVESIKRRKPEVEVTWVVRRVYEPLVASFDFVERTIPFFRSDAAVHLVRLAGQLRQERFDYVLDFEGHARTGLMCFVSRGRRKIGFESAREGARIFYKEVVPDSAERGGHLFERLQEFSAVFGLEPELGNLLPTPFAGEALPAAWREAKSKGRRCVCLVPGRFKSKRAWLGMSEMAQRLAEKLPLVEVFVLGMVPVVFERKLHKRVHDLQAKLDWSQLCSLLAEAELVVANDNGPAQLASLFGTANLTLFTLVSPELRGSYPLNASRNAALCAPGGDASQFRLEEVFEEAKSLLSN